MSRRLRRRINFDYSENNDSSMALVDVLFAAFSATFAITIVAVQFVKETYEFDPSEQQKPFTTLVSIEIPSMYFNALDFAGGDLQSKENARDLVAGLRGFGLRVSDNFQHESWYFSIDDCPAQLVKCQYISPNVEQKISIETLGNAETKLIFSEFPESSNTPNHAYNNTASIWISFTNYLKDGKELELEPYLLWDCIDTTCQMDDGVANFGANFKISPIDLKCRPQHSSCILSEKIDCNRSVVQETTLSLRQKDNIFAIPANCLFGLKYTSYQVKLGLPQL